MYWRNFAPLSSLLRSLLLGRSPPWTGLTELQIVQANVATVCLSSYEQNPSVSANKWLMVAVFQAQSTVGMSWLGGHGSAHRIIPPHMGDKFRLRHLFIILPFAPLTPFLSP